MLALEVYHFLCDVFTPIGIVWGCYIFYRFKLMTRSIFIWCHNLFCNEGSITNFLHCFSTISYSIGCNGCWKIFKTYVSWLQNYEVNEAFYKCFLLSIYIITISYCVQDLYVILYAMDQIWHFYNYYQTKAGNFIFTI